MKFGKSVPQANTHRLTESDFGYDVILSRRRPWRHFTQKSAAIWSLHTQRTAQSPLHLSADAYGASAGCPI